jgi:hypothetical protein
MDAEAYDGSDDHGEYYSGHIFHQYDGTDPHGHGAAAEDHVDFFLEIRCKFIADESAYDSADRD